jgi:hypothetical protein
VVIRNYEYWHTPTTEDRGLSDFLLVK